MSREAIRTSIVTAVEAAKATFSDYTLLIEYDNRIVVDTKTQTDPFLMVRILYLSAEQANLSNNPTHRVWGQIHLAAVVPEGSGSAKANSLLDFFVPKLHLKSFGTVRTMAATTAASQTLNARVYYAMAIPFWSDQPST